MCTLTLQIPPRLHRFQFQHLGRKEKINDKHAGGKVFVFVCPEGGNKQVCKVFDPLRLSRKTFYSAFCVLYIFYCMLFEQNIKGDPKKLTLSK